MSLNSKAPLVDRVGVMEARVRYRHVFSAVLRRPL